MGVFAGPKVKSDGLVFAIDAGNPRSYVGTGITWTNSISSTNSASLDVKDNVYNPYDLQVGDYVLPNSNSSSYPTFSSSNLGSISFDGIDDYCDFIAPNLGTTTTVELWMRLGTSYRERIIFGWLYYSVWCQNGNLGYNTGNGDVYGISSATVTSLGLVNNWKHCVFEMRSDVSYTNNKIYINRPYRHSQTSLREQKTQQIAHSIVESEEFVPGEVMSVIQCQWTVHPSRFTIEH